MIQYIEQTVLETDCSQFNIQISRLAQSENKVGHNTATEPMGTPNTKEAVKEGTKTVEHRRRTSKNQVKNTVAVTHNKIRNRHKESAITHSIEEPSRR